MSFNVRLTGYRGILKCPLVLPRHETYTSVYLLSQPYEFSLVVATAGGAPVTLGPSGFVTWMDYSVLCVVEVPFGKGITYEINNPNRNVTPTNSSPTLSGTQMIDWGPGWSLSFYEAGAISPVGVDLVSEAGPFLTSETGTQLVPP